MVTLQGAVVLFPQIFQITVTGAAPPQQSANPAQLATWSLQCYQLLTSNQGPPLSTKHPCCHQPITLTKSQPLVLDLLRWYLKSPIGNTLFYTGLTGWDKTIPILTHPLRSWQVFHLITHSLL